MAIFQPKILYNFNKSLFSPGLSPRKIKIHPGELIEPKKLMGFKNKPIRKIKNMILSHVGTL